MFILKFNNKSQCTPVFPPTSCLRILTGTPTTCSPDWIPPSILQRKKAERPQNLQSAEVSFKFGMTLWCRMLRLQSTLSSITMQEGQKKVSPQTSYISQSHIHELTISDSVNCHSIPQCSELSSNLAYFWFFCTSFESWILNLDCFWSWNLSNKIWESWSAI